MYGVIYKITNKANGKIYIGQTKRSMYTRFKEHFSDAEDDSKESNHLTHFQRAMLKWGISSFEIEQIDQADTREELNQKEIYWIAHYDSTNREIGYNFTEGGEGGNTTSHCRWYNDGVNEYYIDIEQDEVPDNLVKGRIYKVDNSNTIWINNGKEQKHIHIEDLEKFPNWKRGMLDRGDEWYNKVSSQLKNKSPEMRKRISEGKKKFFKENPDFRNGGNWVKGQTPSNKGKIWITNGKDNKYIFEHELDEWKSKGWMRGQTQNRKGVVIVYKKVYCVELDKVFNSTREAASFLGCKPSSVNAVANGRKKTIKGYHFKYLDEENR